MLIVAALNSPVMPSGAGWIPLSYWAEREGERSDPSRAVEASLSPKL